MDFPVNYQLSTTNHSLPLPALDGDQQNPCG